MVEAVAAIASKAASSASTVGPAAEMQSSFAAPLASGGPGEGLANAFRQTVATLKSHDSNLGSVGGADPVASAKAEMQSGAGKGVLADTTPKATGGPAAANGLGALEQSFDHAVFVSLVSQVVGGVSQATSTLVKQS